MKNPRHINETNGVLVDKSDDSGQIYLEPGHPDYQAVFAGSLGAVAPYVAPSPPEVTSYQVNEERDRRMHSQFDFNTWTFDSNTAALNRITGAATLAGFALAAGAQAGDYLWHGGTTPFSWILNDNSVIQIDAPTMFAIGQAAATWGAAHVFAARALKDMDPIPADFADDAHWLQAKDL